MVWNEVNALFDFMQVHFGVQRFQILLLYTSAPPQSEILYFTTLHLVHSYSHKVAI